MQMINASSVTVMVPAAVPNNNTDVKTNVSETEIVASIEGSFTVIEPVSQGQRRKNKPLVGYRCRVQFMD